MPKLIPAPTSSSGAPRKEKPKLKLICLIRAKRPKSALKPGSQYIPRESQP